MAARYILQRGFIRPALGWTMSRTIYQRPITMATCQPFMLQNKEQCHSYPQLTNPSASFHSSRCLLDEDHFIIQDGDDFKERVLCSDSVIIVDFHADWCNPCKALAPVLDAAIKNTQGQIKLAKVDIDNLQDLAINYSVNSVPTVMAFKGGQEVAKFIGLLSQDKVEAFIEELLR